MGGAGDYAKLAPWDAVRWEGDAPEVRVAGRWYGFRSLDGTLAAEIVEFAKRTWPDRWRKRFEEDLVEVLSRLGRAPGARVRLELADLVTRETVVRDGVAMTEENRDAVEDAADARETGAPPAPRPDPRPDADWARTAPWSGVRFGADRTVDVLLDGRWFRLVSIAGIETADLLAFAERTYGSRAEKRIVEDPVEVLVGLGWEPGGTVPMDLIDLESEEEVRRPAVALTAEKRRAAKRRESGERGSHVVPIVLTRGEAAADLDRLRALLDTRFATRDLRGLDPKALVAEAEARLPERIGRSDFALVVERLVARFGDGHAGVEGIRDHLVEGGFLPFLAEPAGDRIVAVRTDRSGLVDPAHPYLAKLDGRDVEAWRRVAAPLVANGSPAFVRRRTTRLLRHVPHLRREMGLPARDRLEVVLASGNGETRTLAMDSANRRPLYGAWPRTESRLLDGNVGYLRLDAMRDDPEFLDAIDARMAEFRDTRGLVVDLRGNGGGTRHALLRFLPYLLAPDEVVIANVAAPKRLPDEPRAVPGGVLANRFLFPLSALRGETSNGTTAVCWRHGVESPAGCARVVRRDARPGGGRRPGRHDAHGRTLRDPAGLRGRGPGARAAPAGRGGVRRDGAVPAAR